MVIQPVWRHGLEIEALAKQTFLAPSALYSEVSVISPSMYCSYGWTRGRPRTSPSAARPARRRRPGRTTRCRSPPSSGSSVSVGRRLAAGVSAGSSAVSGPRSAAGGAAPPSSRAAAPLTAVAVARMDFRRISVLLCRCPTAAAGGVVLVVHRGCGGRSDGSTGRCAGGRRPRVQARADAATARMMMMPWTVSRQVDSTSRKSSRASSSSRAKAPAAADSTQPRPPPSTTPPSTTAVMAWNS